MTTSDTSRTDAIPSSMFKELQYESGWEDRWVRLEYAQQMKTKFERKNRELREALQTIASWTMHSGVDYYQRADGYSDMYYLIESEVNKARDIARAAIAKLQP